MSNITSYNAKDCTVLVNGIYITGLSDNMVTGEKDESFFSTSVGAQGDVVKSITNNDLGSVTISIQQTSPQKAFLLNLANNQENFPLWVENASLGQRFGGTQASIQKFPKIQYKKEAEDLEIEFKIFDYTVEVTEK